jgi:L-seryl-tRNA(Ser) seleniumtransferase
MTRSQQNKAAGDQAKASEGAADAYRSIPPVHQLVGRLVEDGWGERVPQLVITDAARAAIEQYRAELASGGKGEIDVSKALVQRAAAILDTKQRPPLASIINATGIIIHTGLGRAPLAERAIAALTDVARSYAPVELDMPTGERGKRATIVRKLLCELTGAESATVVNNNTAALLIVLSTLAADRNVIVSRGELIEIGGSFRLPEIIGTGGAILREVGTTNKTRISDYANAIDDHAAAIIKIHTSNYRVEGFTEGASMEELVALGREHGLPVVHDIGSGALKDVSAYGLPANEPDACSSIAAGCDLVLFSGDKLLGGPQAGIIVGREEWVKRIEKHPMMRAVRVDKLTLAALGATLQLHRDAAQAQQEVPVLAAVAMPMDELKQRADGIVRKMNALDGAKSAQAHETSAYIGGGSVPAQAVPSIAIELQPSSISDEQLATRLRTGTPGVVARIKGGSVWFDLRTVFAQQDEALCDAIAAALRQ